MTARETAAVEALGLLREPFAEHLISKLPKETRKQIDERNSDSGKLVWNCPVCGGRHHKDAIHLDYVGHAALTDRLLDTDLEWSWEPMAFNESGLPAFDGNGGLWIKLTICGVSRFGYGSAEGKSGGDAVKEIIGDALRNAAMRFGAALDLWHKGDLHVDDEPKREKVPGIVKIKAALGKMMTAGNAMTDLAEFKALVKANKDDIKTIRDANHEWWCGDGADWEGFGAWLEGRYEALTPKQESLGFQMLASALAECETRNDLNSLLDQHGAVADALDGEESRKWEQLFNEREAAIMALANVSAG